MLAATSFQAPTALAAWQHDGFTPWTQAPHPRLVHKLRQDIRLRRDHAVRRAWKLGIILTPSRRERLTVDVDQLRAMDARWRLRAHRYRLALEQRAPVYAALACIHGYEGSWSAYSSAGPYYGGYQMDPAFEARYGGDYMQPVGRRPALAGARCRPPPPGGPPRRWATRPGRRRPRHAASGDGSHLMG